MTTAIPGITPAVIRAVHQTFSMQFEFVKSTKNYDLYQQVGGINKLYVPKREDGFIKQSITVEIR